MNFSHKHLFFISCASFAFAAEEPSPIHPLDAVVVTSARSEQPLVTTLDAHAIAQPIPAHDGADILKSIPGFCVVRKGGIDGDPVLRGQAGSRLGVLLDGEGLLGGCGNRMDPPTAYVFPSAFDSITVFKGPQTVRFGPGLSAGVVLFERNDQHYPKAEANLRSTLTVGSGDRFNAALEARGGAPKVYARTTLSWAEAGDYADGNGARVHSDYERWHSGAELGWTPDINTILELSAARSDGKASYADRAMDGVKFDRDNIGLKISRRNLNTWCTAVEGQVFYNYVDHVMDNFSRRTFTPTAQTPGRAVSNPDRRTLGGRLSVTLVPRSEDQLVLGFDTQCNRHSVRSTINESTSPFLIKARLRDADFHQSGVFADYTLALTPTSRLIGGARLDHWQSEDHRIAINTGMATVPNPTAGNTRQNDLSGGFLRYEHDFCGSTAYLGIGQVERFPDYWELFNKESANSVSAFDLAQERTFQLDTGIIYRIGSLAISASAFANIVNDFILIQNSYAKVAGATQRFATIARNIDSGSYGGEIGLGWRATEHWQIDTSLAYVRGRNKTDSRPLAQQPPLEVRFAASYRLAHWSVGGLLRAVAAQNRFALGQGNIVGQDIGPTGGFAVYSLHASWQIDVRSRLTVGVDNLLDKTYAEHISRAGSMVSGYSQTTRVNDPGRSFWATAEFKY